MYPQFVEVWIVLFLHRNLSPYLHLDLIFSCCHNKTSFIYLYFLYSLWSFKAIHNWMAISFISHLTCDTSVDNIVYSKCLCIYVRNNKITMIQVRPGFFVVKLERQKKIHVQLWSVWIRTSKNNRKKINCTCVALLVSLENDPSPLFWEWWMNWVFL